MTMQLRGKKALITGASTGIGRALAKAMAAAGVELVISGRRTEALQAVANEIEAAGGKRPHVIAADLSVRGEAKLLGDRTLEALGAVDILVNNAGVAMGGSQAVVGDDDEARVLFETNYWSALALVKSLMTSIRLRRGAVVNVSSIGAYTTMPLAGHYSSSKAAMQLMTETLRLELRDTGVHVLAVMPGPVETGMLAEMRQVPGAAGVIASTPRGNPDVLAKKIVRGLERGHRNIVYPTLLTVVRHFPSIALRVTALKVRAIDVTDQRKVLGGSQGGELARDARARYESEAT